MSHNSGEADLRETYDLLGFFSTGHTGRIMPQKENGLKVFYYCVPLFAMTRFFRTSILSLQSAQGIILLIRAAGSRSPISPSTQLNTVD